MALPFSLPLEPMLSRLEDEIPSGPGWRYEPKWDGFRALVGRTDNGIRIFSRNQQPLERYFPELEQSLCQAIPPDSAIDGEIVIVNEDRLDFEALLQRIHPAASRIQLLSRTTPASFIAFDLLALRGTDLRSESLEARRAKLESSLSKVESIVITPQTDDHALAQKWFERFEASGLDGIIAKRAELGYVPGERLMVKVKHHRTADCVVGGYRVHKGGDGIGSLLLGLYDEQGVLHHVGHTSSFSSSKRREILAQLEPLTGGSSFGEGRTPGGPSRWSQQRDASWISVTPRLVCEVEFDHLQGSRFRHATRFLRWRPDKDPRDCTYEQFERLRLLPLTALLESSDKKMTES